MSKCKYCGGKIEWVKTLSGRMMPCDPKIIPYIFISSSNEKIVTMEGGVLNCVTANVQPYEATGFGRKPHFATCKNYQKPKKVINKIQEPSLFENDERRE